eukprot:CAMPEP_0178753660 /NCGR_PEP_ID=MMETSP0744-20121128/11731_1 /TAXON_ID=913974 /ORGANISM="Nitzschia punctata, Strain CCMP561" /LENGTH=550 /DNA_ID=CAMNT_0020407493 /DNA_START=29 /DNA_END=1681 /DNA_ORIENTATION=+
MILNNVFKTTFFLAFTASLAAAQGDDPATPALEPLLLEPAEVWSAQLLPDVNLGSVEILRGNGVSMSPDGKTAVVTTVGATVYAFNPYSGQQKWVYQAPAIGSTSIARSHSTVTFHDDSWMVYSVVDDENSLTPTTRVIALDMDGNELWISESLDGVAMGDPVISSDGGLVFLTHNADEGTNGYFTILNANSTGAVWYSESSGEEVAFGPIGIYHNPTEGNYDPLIQGAPVSEGENNPNDFLMWSQTPKPEDVSIEDGFLYGFQLPRDFNGNTTDVAFFELGDFQRDFQSISPPVITNEGFSAYWGVTRSSFRVWDNKRFSRARTEAAGFERNDDFLGQAVWAAPALSNDGPEPIVFGGSASTEFVRMNFDFTQTSFVTTDSLIYSRAIVDGETRAVYYVEANGNLHQADVDTLADIWNFTVNFAVEGQMAITPRNDVVVVADTRGIIKGVQVAEIPVTDAPSDFPSDMPSMAPTGDDTPAPTAASVSTPAPTPSVAAVGDSTDSPVAPVSVPTGETTTEAPVSGGVASSYQQSMISIAALVASFAWWML